MKTDTQIYDTVIVEWHNSPYSWYFRHTLHDISLSDALSVAKESGYVEPKWYEFWKEKARIFGFDDE